MNAEPTCVWLVRPVSVACALALMATAGLSCGGRERGLEVAYLARYDIDPQVPGQRCIADVDGDGAADIVTAVDFESGDSVGLYWYHFPEWQRGVIARGVNFRGDDLESYDMDGDGDRDIVVTTDEDAVVTWYANPGPAGLTDAAERVWVLDSIGVHGAYAKDVEVGDLDGDNRPEVVVRGHDSVSVFTRRDSSWVCRTLACRQREGMALGDLTGDGRPDIVLNGYWLTTPDDMLEGAWQESVIDSLWFTQHEGGWQDNCANVAVGPGDSLRAMSVYVCHSEKPGWPVMRYRQTAADWVGDTVLADFGFCETLVPADLDGDGIREIVVGQMPRGRGSGNAGICYGRAVEPVAWEYVGIMRSDGTYDACVGDLGSDGDMDIIGCRDYNQPPLQLWENTVSQARHWRHQFIDSHRPESEFGSTGLVTVDLDGDGVEEIATGSLIYRRQMVNGVETWTRRQTCEGFDSYFAVDTDGDGTRELVGVAHDTLVRIHDPLGRTAPVVETIGPIPHARTQGHVVVDILGDSTPELVFTRGKELFCASSSPSTDTPQWQLRRLYAGNEEEGVAAADFDRDGHTDLVVVAGDGHSVQWLRNPGTGGGDWGAHEVGPSTQWLDRVAVADLDNDGDPDIVATEETPDWQYNASLYWYECQGSPDSLVWVRHTIATLRSINSLSLGDIDHDGDMDIVCAEHTDQRDPAGAADNLTLVYENTSRASTWCPRVVERGPHTSHLGADLTDIDGDGDLDIVSIAWYQTSSVHLWENLEYTNSRP